VHGVRPALIELLSALDWQEVPADARQNLEMFQHWHLQRMLVLAEELAQLARGLKARGIPFALFKGPALAVQLYGDLAAREYNDFDLIVPPGRVAEAEALLEQRGYRAALGDPAFRRFFQGYQGQSAFRHPDSPAALDLHWSFSGSFLPFPLASDGIWQDLVTVSIAGEEIPTLNPDDIALLLAGHGTKEGWRLLMWLRDFAVLVERWPGLDWRQIHRRAVGNGCGDAVLLACALAERVLGVPVPTALTAGVAASRRAAALADFHGDRLPHDLDRHHLDDLALCDRRRDRLRAGLGFALAPTPSDFAALKLPQPLWPAYYLVRPARLVAQALRGRLPLP